MHVVPDLGYYNRSMTPNPYDRRNLQYKFRSYLVYYDKGLRCVTSRIVLLSPIDMREDALMQNATH